MSKFKEAFTKNTSNKAEPTIEKIYENNDIDDITDKLRKANIKIKIVIPTRFGKEIVFFSNEDAIKAAKIAKTKKIDNKSIFVEV